MITEDYVSFETAKILKEKGFEQESDYATSWYANQYYKNSCQGEWFEGEHQIIENIDDKCNISYLSEMGIFIPAPTLQMTMKWLREVHNIHVELTPICTGDSEDDLEWHYGWAIKTTIFTDRWTRHNAEHISYEDACEAAIKYCLENLI